EKVMLEPIGMVGWRAPTEIIDETGLVSPAVSARRKTGVAGWFADIVKSERPDWIAERRIVVEGGGAFAGRGEPFRSGAEREEVLAGYRQVKRWSGTPAPNSLLLFRRVGASSISR